MNLILFCLYWFFMTANGQFFGTDSVRFDVEPSENCDVNSKWTWYLGITTVNNTHVSITANGTLDRNFDNSITILFEFYQQSANGEWKRVIRVSKKQACSFLRTIGGDLFIQIGHEIGLEDPKCPVPKNYYHIENRLIDVSSTIFGKFLVGKFKCFAKAFGAKKEVLFCGQREFRTTKI